MANDAEGSQNPPQPQRTLAYYHRAVFVSCFCCFLLFGGDTAGEDSEALMSGALGYWKMTINYSTNAALCLVIPAILHHTEKCGIKDRWILMTMGVLYALTMLAEARSLPLPGQEGYTANLVIEIILGVVAGLASQALWVGQGVYLARCAWHVSQCDDDDHTHLHHAANYNALFMMVGGLSGVVGMLIASVVLSAGLSRSLFYLLVAGYMMVGAFGMIGVPSIPPLASETEDESQAHQFSQMIRLLCRSRPLQLMLPTVFFEGLYESFFFGDFLSYFVAPCIGPGLALTASTVSYVAFTVACGLWGQLVASGCTRLITVMRVSFVLRLLVLVVLLLSALRVIPLFSHHYYFDQTSANPWVLSGEGPEWWELFAPMCCAALGNIAGAAYSTQPAVVMQTLFPDKRIVPATSWMALLGTAGRALGFAMSLVIPGLALRIGLVVAVKVFAFLALTYMDVEVFPVHGAGGREIVVRPTPTVPPAEIVGRTFEHWV